MLLNSSSGKRKRGRQAIEAWEKGSETRLFVGLLIDFKAMRAHNL